MGEDHHQRPEKSVRDLARQRVLAALRCVDSLWPDLQHSARQDMIRAILKLRSDRPRLSSVQVNGAQITEMVWRNMQCVHHRCPMLLFGEQLAEEINELLGNEE
jgi:hypothetical protein